MESNGVGLFPLPPRGRVPNFKGCAEAAARIRELEEYRSAKTVMVNPDAPQLPIRRISLLDGKMVLMATPGLRRGFVLLNPQKLRNPAMSATIAGAMKNGKPARLKSVRVDLIVEGSVAVDENGGRVGKGSGWGDLEYALLRESGATDENVKAVTTVHDLQVVKDSIPMEPHDMPVDFILTPTRTVAVECAYPKPSGIRWEELSAGKIEAIRKILK